MSQKKLLDLPQNTQKNYNEFMQYNHQQTCNEFNIAFKSIKNTEIHEYSQSLSSNPPKNGK